MEISPRNNQLMRLCNAALQALQLANNIATLDPNLLRLDNEQLQRLRNATKTLHSVGSLLDSLHIAAATSVTQEVANGQPV